jgi:O-methyltransferase
MTKEMNKEIFCSIVKPFTMTSKQRIHGLFNSLEEIRINKVEGDIIECGVWKGGNILGIMEYLDFHKIYDKRIWLYDTFQGMTNPSQIDEDYVRHKASDILGSVMCYSPLEEVKKTLSLSKYPEENIKIVIGDVRETLNLDANLPEKLSILRLDTDWYDSTKKELEVLYPLLDEKGILIVDDYGHWKGCKVAVDEYFVNEKIKIEVLDYTGIKITRETIL